MLDKRVKTLEEAVAGVRDGATVLVAGFGNAGIPVELLHALIDQGARDLTIVSNNAGSGKADLAALLAAGRVRNAHSDAHCDQRFVDGAAGDVNRGVKREPCPESAAVRHGVGTVMQRITDALGGFLEDR